MGERMAMFSRFRRGAEFNEEDPIPAILPEINQRVMIIRGGHDPVPSRIDDHRADDLVISLPSVPLENGDSVMVTWEEEGAWYSLDSNVSHLDANSPRPTISVNMRGRVNRFDDRRGDNRAEITLPLELRVLVARVVKPGRILRTHTSEISTTAFRFTTSAPFAPGDLIESTLTMGDTETLTARLKVIRVDSTSGSWRQSCTATFDEILRSDRSRLAGFIERIVSESQSSSF